MIKKKIVKENKDNIEIEKKTTEKIRKKIIIYCRININ